MGGFLSILINYAFDFKQFFLYVKPAAVTDKGAVRADHSVAWNYDHYTVTVIRHADRARRFRVAYLHGYVLVRARFGVEFVIIRDIIISLIPVGEKYFVHFRSAVAEKPPFATFL